MLYYLRCTDSCEYLKGDLLGIGLEYVGIALMLILAGLVLFRFFQLIRVLLAGALGGEVYLLGFQIYQGVYCRYCLIFAVLLLVAFVVNHEKSENMRNGKRGLYFLGEVNMGKRFGQYPLIIFLLLGLAIFILGFSGSTTPAYGAQIVPSYGIGNSEIRLYSDYFCPACRSVEPEIEPLLSGLVTGGKTKVSFIDVSIHKESLIYIKYFLYYTMGGESFKEVIRFRSILFQASDKGIRGEEALRKYLKKNGVLPRMRDVSVSLQAMRNSLTEDKIRATPTMVIIDNGSRNAYKGKIDISAALKSYVTSRR
ncbi:MAG: thioredoxin domain-containing protein [Syntrophales bacterium]|jgi:thiol:disulfide interchange protein DsbA